MKKLLSLSVALFATVAFGNLWDAVTVKGVTDKANPVGYGRGEPIVFTLRSEGVDPAAKLDGYAFAWQLTGDDGQCVTSTVPFRAGDFAHVTAKLDIPGFVRLEGWVVDRATGEKIRRDKPAKGSPSWKPAMTVYFDGGAGVDVGNIVPEKPEPADFDAWWTAQKKILADVPMTVTRELYKTENGCDIYRVSVTCAGPRPVTGYLFVPTNAAPKSCGARVAFQGYGFHEHKCPEWASWGAGKNHEILLEINAHGFELGRDKAYYDAFGKSIRTPDYSYAFSPEENAKPETAYFRGMAFRVMRALAYVKSLPEWNGKSLIAEGGSQGGLQTSWAAGLDPDVTLARPSITWGCDFAMTSGPRHRLKGNWYIPYAPGLDYYDSINMIRRAKCPVEVTRAGLGDYTCPPSGLAAYYNAIPTPKSITWVQGSEHGYVPPAPNQTFTIKAGHEQTGAESPSDSGGPPAEDVLVRYPDYPAAIERDDAYAVRVRQGAHAEELVVWNHCEKSMLTERTRGGDVNRRFCEFAFAGRPVTVDIAVRGDVHAYKVFPARLGLKHSFTNGVLSVTLTESTYFGIQLNDYDKTILSVFVDAPEDAADVPARDRADVLYVEGWRDAPTPDGRLALPKGVREIYLAPGAVLNARLAIDRPGVRVHGRGMILDPMGDIFRYDQSANPARGLLRIGARDVSVEDVKFVDARTFNVICWGDGCRFRHVKILSTMMCSDGLTNGGRDLVVDGAWIYNGDNALVVSGLADGVYSNVVIGTSCRAIYPQGTNRRVRMTNVDVFRADEGVIANEYNGVLRRGNKWSEMGQGLQKREPGPQDLEPQADDFFFDTFSAVDATYVGYFFRGRNMGNLPKTFAFRNLSVPLVSERAGWRGIGETNGVAIAVRNDPKRWLVTGNYALAVTNLYLAGERAAAFPSFAVKAKEPDELKLDVVTDPSLARTVPLTADRVTVDWKNLRGVLRSPPTANLLADNAATRSIWQRCPSWSVKFDACRRDEHGSVIYRLFQCEKGAGMQAVLTDRIKAAGFGPYRLAFEAKAKNEKPFGLTVQAVGNERRNETLVPDLARDGAWHRYETAVDFAFDPLKADLAALFLATTAPTEEVQFRAFELTMSHP